MSNEPKRTEGAPEDWEMIDTSKMNEEKRAALEMTERAREQEWSSGSFGGGLFMGAPDWSLIDPFPEQSEEDRNAGRPFLTQLENLLKNEVDADQIDREGEIPQPIIDALAEMKAFAIKIPTQYGGLGLSQTNYCRAAILLGSVCGSLTALLSAHQSIGIPQPLLEFGTEEQKQKYLTRISAGEISAFALTEPEVGSDPARMTTAGVPTEDGSEYVINGKKLWCTNGTRAGVIVVMARTPAAPEDPKKRAGITAFIVEMNSPGVKVEHRCHFMGLKALYNGVLTFSDVRVPKENIIGGLGRGLKVALTTLNTGRLTLPAACLGLSRRCLDTCLTWSREREQWGAPIGHHAAIAGKLTDMAADVFGLEAMTYLTAGLVDQKRCDIRIEAAFSKMWCTEAAWRVVDETMAIRGGRGYETADSLKARGEQPIAVERWMRDCRINLIFEGSSEIMRLFIAREALDPHLKKAGAAGNSRLPMSERMKSAAGALGFYARWYPLLWLPLPGTHEPSLDPALRKHLRAVQRGSRRLARTLFHSMLRYGAKLEREQLLLGRLVDVGAELFVQSAALAFVESAVQRGRNRAEVVKLTDYLCRRSQIRIRASLRKTKDNQDRRGYRLARTLLEDDLAWLREDIV
jgi:alkylation response protein AidB-like acyl-CoA dehydrogenase